MFIKFHFHQINYLIIQKDLILINNQLNFIDLLNKN